MKKKILIISDSHGDTTWLNTFVFDRYDAIIHAGDHLMSTRQIAKITPFYVDGNNDWGRQHFMKFKINNLNFVLTHGDEHVHGSYHNHDWYRSLHDLAKVHSADILVFGHTHIPIIKSIDGVTLINPGSVSFSRHNGKKCYIILEIDDNNILSIDEHII